MSAVWKYFTKLEKKVKCLLCSKELSYNGGSTGSMLNHLKLIHPNISKDEAPKNQPKMSNILHSRLCDKRRSDKITNLIAEMIVRDLLPIKIVEAVGFQALITYLEPGYTLPTRKTLSARIDKLYEDSKENLKQELQQLDSLSLTTDCWTSCNAESYMTVTAHYLKDWKIKTVALSTKYMKASHTAENLRLVLEEIAEEFNIMSKIIGCVHDNAANVDLAMKQCEMIKENVGCAAHTLQLSINAGFNQSPKLQATVAAASRLVGHFKHSYKATAVLQEKQALMNLPQHKLAQQNNTRWNSKLAMFETLIEQRWAVTSVLSDRTITKLSDARTLELKDDQWQNMSDLLEVLKPLKAATTAVSAENYVSMSCVSPIIHSLVTRHLLLHENDSELIKKYKTIVSNDLKLRFPSSFSKSNQDINNHIDAFLIASFLDPRYKDLTFLDENIKNIVQQDIKQKLINVELNIQETIPAKQTKLDVTQDAIQMLLGENYCTTAQRSKDDEMAHYCGLPVAMSQEDPLTWWKAQQTILPRLSTLAKAYLTISASSVPSERMFSSAGRLVTKLRNQLSTKNVDKILFLNKNL